MQKSPRTQHVASRIPIYTRRGKAPAIPTTVPFVVSLMIHARAGPCGLFLYSQLNLTLSYRGLRWHTHVSTKSSWSLSRCAGRITRLMLHWPLYHTFHHRTLFFC